MLFVDAILQSTRASLFHSDSVENLSTSCDCAATDTGVHVTLICLAVSMATASLVAGGWQSNGTKVQVRVLNETTGPQLEIVQISPTAGDYQSVCLLLSLVF